MGSLLTQIQDAAYALRWSLHAAALMLIQVISLRRILPLNHRPGEQEVLPHFGPGNLLTLVRGTIIALLSGFLWLHKLPGGWAWMPAILYLTSAITDFLDGYLARVSNTVTRLGETLDMNLDALGLLVVTLLAFQLGTVPWWYLPFGFARYLFLLGLYFHQKAGHPIQPLNPSNNRRLFAGIQMGFIGVMLFPVVGPPATTFAASIFLIPFLSMFVLDFLQITGRSDALTTFVRWNVEPLKRWLVDWLPTILRAVIVFIYGYHAQTFGMVANPKVDLVPEAARLIYFWSAILFILLFALGTLNRAAAILALVTCGIQLEQLPFTIDYQILLFALIYILFAGSGKISLWKPEEWLITNRAGQKKSF